MKNKKTREEIEKNRHISRCKRDTTGSSTTKEEAIAKSREVSQRKRESSKKREENIQRMRIESSGMKGTKSYTPLTPEVQALYERFSQENK